MTKLTLRVLTAVLAATIALTSSTWVAAQTQGEQVDFLLPDAIPAYDVQCLLDGFEACIAHLRFPLRIPHAFGEHAVLKLMFAAAIRAADRWRGIQVGEFEQRQLRALRDELNRAHAQRASRRR